MKLTSIREAACIQGTNLMNQLSARKGYKSIAPEINSLSEIFGIEFDKHIYKSLLEEIDFKDQKTLERRQNTSNKIQFLIQEFPVLLKRNDFINLFSQILNLITLNTAKEIFEGLTKLLKLDYENQFKVLVSFFYSMNDKLFQEIIPIFSSKCNDYYQKRLKGEFLSRNIVQHILMLINSIPDFKEDTFLRDTFVSYLASQSYLDDDENDEKLNYLEDYEKMINSDSTEEDNTPFERVLMDLGPYVLNNNINLSKCESLDFNLDEKRLVSFILFLCKNQTYTENKETLSLNKFFLKSLSDLSIQIDENNNNQKNTVTWNIDNFFKQIKPQIESFNVEEIFKHFDDPLFCIKDKKSFEYLNNILMKIKPINYQPYFYNLIFKRWENELNQIDFISFLIGLNQGDLFTFKNSQRKIKKATEFLGQQNKNISPYYVETWSCLDLIDILFKISKGNHYNKIKDLFDWPIQNLPEILIISLATITPEEDEFIYHEIVNEIMPNFINNFQNYTNVLEELWKENSELVINSLCYFYKNNSDLTNLSKILDFTQKLKDSLIVITVCNDHVFTVNLSILAAKRDFLRLEQWLEERIKNVGDEFILVLLNYLKENIINQCKEASNLSQKEIILEKSQLSLDSLSRIFENLSTSKISKNQKISKFVVNEINNTFQPIIDLFEELQTHTANSDEIEEEANKLFNNLFQNENYSEIITTMTNYKSASNQRENEIYACMIHGILDEYRFFHNYPEKELKSISTLFGLIIQNSLIDGILENIALKYVLEGVKKPSGKMLIFGTLALEQFCEKLSQWPNYINFIYNDGKNIAKINPKLFAKIEEKYNEIFNKTKASEVKPQANPSNITNLNPPNVQKGGSNYTNNYNFESDKKVNNGLSSVPKMDKIPDGEFILNFKQFPYGANVNNQYAPHFIPGPTHNANFKSPQAQNNPIPPQHSQHFMNQQELLYNHAYSMYDKKFVASHMMDKEFPKDDKETKRFNSSEKNIMHSQNERIEDLDNRHENKNEEDISRWHSGEKGRPRLEKPKPNSFQNKVTSPILSIYKNETESAPPQEIIEKINLIFNQISKNNINEKSNDLKAVLHEPSLVKWFSTFFILNRVANEFNNHSIYRDLIDHIESKELNSLLIKDTITIIKKLLASETIVEPAEKNFLKNLGNWLGILTLAKNRPILAKDLDIKEILFEAYEKGHLISVVPLVIKILENSSKTKVFHAKNPWIVAILSLLKEVLLKPNLRRNIYYEIENLFKRLETDLSKIQETKELEQFTFNQNSNDFKVETVSSSVLSNSPEIKNNDLLPFISSGILDQYIFDFLKILISIPSTSNDNRQITKNELTNILSNSLCNAINEIIGPVIDRAVNISLLTTKDLIIKDFTFEKDEKKFKTASNLCIKSLAGSLAMVTCKDPLKTNFASNLKELLSKKGFETETLNEFLTKLDSNDILDIGCNYIQNIVIRKAIDKIEKDSTIKDQINKRRNQKFEDKAEIMQKLKILPPSLRPNFNGLSNDQYKIYEEFEKVYETNKKDSQKNIAFIRIIIPILKDSFDVLINQPNIAMRNYELCMKNIELQYSQNEPLEFSEDDEILNQVSRIVIDSKYKNEAFMMELLQINFRYINLVSKLPHSNTLLTIYSEILKGLVTLFPPLTKEATICLMKNDDLEIRFKYSIHYLFLKKNIFDLGLYESSLLNLLKDPLNSQCARTLISSLIENKVLSNNFRHIPHYLYDSNSNSYFDLFFNKIIFKSQLNLYLNDFKQLGFKDNNSFNLYKDRVMATFKLFFSDPNEILKIQEIKNEDQLNCFIMIITETFIQNCFSYNDNSNIYCDRLIYSDIDNLTTFCFCLLKIIPTNKGKLFENILFAIYRVFHMNYVKNINNFNQRPYYRIIMNFCNLLYNSAESYLSGTKKYTFFFILAEFLKVLKPQNYPAFVFAWLDIVSSKYFSEIFFEIDKSQETMLIKYEKYISLILELFRFLRSNYQEKFKDIAFKTFLNSVNKFCYSLLKTYPEFLSYYYLPLINALSLDSFQQLKNIILSATPQDIDQPDPYVCEFKIDTLSEIKIKPQYFFNIQYLLSEQGFYNIEDYFKGKNEKYLDELIKNLNRKEAQNNYQILNLIYLYLIEKNSDNMERNAKISELYEIFVKLLLNLNSENRDLLINSMINELRYPNRNSFYTMVLYFNLLKQIKNEAIEENLIKNLYERLIHKPFSWGIYITCFEMNKYISKTDFQKKNFLKVFGVEKFLEAINKYVSESKFNKNLNNFNSC